MLPRSIARLFRLQFSLAQLLSLIGLVAIGLGLARYHFDREFIRFLITSMLLVAAVSTTAGLALCVPLLLVCLATSKVSASDRRGFVTIVLVASLYNLFFWMLLFA